MPRTCPRSPSSCAASSSVGTIECSAAGRLETTWAASLFSKPPATWASWATKTSRNRVPRGTGDCSLSSEEACHRAGLAPWAAPADTRGSNLFLPDGGVLNQLRAAVLFTPEECRELIGADLAEVIESMMLDSPVGPPDDDRESAVDDRLTDSRSVDRDGDVVLAIPGGVTMSVVHRTLGARIECGDRRRSRRLPTSSADGRPASDSQVHAVERVGTPDELDHRALVSASIDSRSTRSPRMQRRRHLGRLPSWDPSTAPMSEVVDELMGRLPAVRAALGVAPDRGSVFDLVGSSARTVARHGFQRRRDRQRVGTAARQSR